MAEKKETKQTSFQLKPMYFVGLLVMAALLFGSYYLKTHIKTGVDRSNYLAVAETFLYKNPTIAQKLGKVISVNLLGAGGSAGKLSYNSFNVRGETKSGLCQVTLEKDGEGYWDVKEATLMAGGNEFDIPVSRKEEKRSIKLFSR